MCCACRQPACGWRVMSVNLRSTRTAIRATHVTSGKIVAPDKALFAQGLLRRPAGRVGPTLIGRGIRAEP